MGTATIGGWRKSSYSNANGGDCVEVRNVRDVIAVRDTKNRAGTVLSFPARALGTFAADIKKR
jgi:hypothetical protein